MIFERSVADITRELSLIYTPLKQKDFFCQDVSGTQEPKAILQYRSLRLYSSNTQSI